MDNSNDRKKHRNNDKVVSLYALSVSGNRNLPLSTLKGLDPMTHCALEKGEFVTVSESTDRCVTARGKVFSDDDPDSIIAGYDYNYEMVGSEDGEIELTSETKNILPAPRSRKNIGVGEVVTIESNVGVKWHIDNKLVSIIKRKAKELCIKAGDKGGICTITASYKRKGKTITKNIKFSIAEPQSLRYSLGDYQDYNFPNKKGSMLYHPKDTYLGIVGLKIQLLPTSVNFSEVLVREVNCASVNTGYFKDIIKGVICHIGPPTNNQCSGFGEASKFNVKNNKVNIANTFDTVGGGEDSPVANIGDGGAMKLTIPLEWSLVNSDNWKSMGNVKQDLVLSANGNITVSKGNFSRTFYRGNDYPDPTFVNHKKGNLKQKSN
jgi:hypothetical protein